MENKKKYQRPKTYQLIEQKFALIRAYPEATCSIKGREVLYWSGYLCPTPLSRNYYVTLTYKLGKRPQVTLLGENIIGLDRQNFPHKYNIDKLQKRVDICIHLPYEFNSGMLIANTIIPWAIEWLYFYEIWLATDKWCGGGAHSGEKNNACK